MKTFIRWIGLALICVAPALAAIDSVHVQSFSFTPQNITIAMGDTVVWYNTNGFHSVHHNATPSLFGTSIANAPWTYTFIFNTLPAGEYDYICQEHPSQMQGSVTVQAANSAPEPPAPKLDLNLEQNYPNPFNSTTSISFSLPTQSLVQLAVLNVLGQTVRELYNGSLEQGLHHVSFDASGLSSGLYYYKLTTPYGSVARKMSYLK